MAGTNMTGAIHANPHHIYHAWKTIFSESKIYRHFIFHPATFGSTTNRTSFNIDRNAAQILIGHHKLFSVERKAIFSCRILMSFAKEFQYRNEFSCIKAPGTAKNKMVAGQDESEKMISFAEKPTKCMSFSKKFLRIV